MEQKMDYLYKEIHVSYILKQLRVLKALAREGMSQRKWRRLQAIHECSGYPSDDEI